MTMMGFMLKRKGMITEKYVQRMYNFSKFCSKVDRADVDILKKYIQTDSKNDLVTAI